MSTYTIKAWITIQATTKEQALELLAEFEQAVPESVTNQVQLSTEGDLEEL